MANDWAFITSHGAVLLEVHRNPDTTVSDLARAVELTERQTHRVLSDLVDAGYIRKTRIGRRNHYAVDNERPMRHRSVRHHGIDELLAALGS